MTRVSGHHYWPIALSAAMMACTSPPSSGGGDNPEPTVSAIVPASAVAASPTFTLTVTGTGFVSGTVVRWNGTAQPTTFVSATQLSASIAAADILTAGSAAVTVFTPAPGGGTSGAEGFTISDALNPAPSIASLAPANAAAGSVAFTLTVTGAEFAAASQVMWNGSARVTTFVSSTQLHAAISAEDLAAPGTVQVTVVNPAPGGGTSAALPFSVDATSPSIQTLLPAGATVGASAFTLSVTGTNFVSGSKVQWNGSARTTTFVSTTQLTAQITAADVASSAVAQITVLNPGGGSSSALPFSVVAASPSIQMLLPAGMTVGAPPFTLSVTGTNFVSGSKVQWNGSARTTTFVSTTQLTAQITAADVASSAVAQITVLNPGGTVSPALPYTIDAPPQLSVGGGQACALKPGAPAYCWGSNAYSFVSAPALAPTAVPMGMVFRQIAAAASHACGLTTDGTAYCWGIDINGELGDQRGGGNASLTPVRVSGGLTWSAIAVGDRSCALTTAGVAYCWGPISNSAMNAQDRVVYVPTAVPSAPAFVSITVGADHVCGLTGAGAAYCWGQQGAGQTGNGTISASDQIVPVTPSGNHVFTAISAGGSHTCAIDTSGVAWCWGAVESLFGSLGNGGAYGTAAGSATPVRVGGAHVFQSVAAGNAHSCALDSTGAAWCWGEGYLGVLGGGTSAASANTPVAVAGGMTFRTLSAGAATCGVVTSGGIYCWGPRANLGIGSSGIANVPLPVTGGLTFTDIAIAVTQTCGLTSSGSTYCWGTTRLQGDPALTEQSAPTLLAGVPAFVALSNGAGESGSFHTAAGFSPGIGICGRTAAGAVYCWGHNPPALLSLAVPVTSIAVGRGSICGLSQSGQAYCVGFLNAANQDLDGQTPVFGGANFSAITLGTGDFCGLASGVLRCAGINNSGEVGSNAANNNTVLTPVAGGLTIANAASSTLTSCGVTSAGAGYCWGRVPILQSFGSFSALAASDLSTPTAVPGGLTFTTIVPGYNGGFLSTSNICGLLVSGAAECWGIDGAMLGTTAGTPSATPALVEGPAFAKLRVGATHACGLTAAGAAWCWGHQDVGELGNGVFGYLSTPTLVTW